jgi:hypothetical protein
MNHTPDSGNIYLSMISAFFAAISFATIQPALQFFATLVAIFSGIYSIYINYKKSKRKKHEKL